MSRCSTGAAQDGVTPRGTASACPCEPCPSSLEGHREVAPLDGDDTAEARILWRHLQWSLAHLPRGAVPGQSWGERPLAWLLEVLRFFLDGPPPRWRALAP